MRPSLFEYAGGSEAFLRLAQAHHRLCLLDPELNHPFSHPDQNPDHIERLAAYWGEVMGGPRAYSDLGTGQSEVLRMHAEPGDMTDLGGRFVACFVQAIEDAGLPNDPEFRAVLRSYMEWAVADVVSQGAGPPHGTPLQIADDIAMPQWSWDGLIA